jgi:hypothetical protein
MAKYLYGYHEERGFADLYVTDRNGKTVWEAHYPSFYESNGEMLEETTIFEDGFMKNAEDTEGLEFYLKSISVINKDDKLVEIDDDDDDDDDDEDEYAAGGTTRITPKVKAIADAHIKAKQEGKFDDPVVSSKEELFEQLRRGKTFSTLLKEVEIRYVSITSLILAGDTFGHVTDAYKKGVYKGFKTVLGSDFEMGGVSYAAGGTIEAKIKKRLKNAFELPIQVAIYVPSTRDKDIIIPKREMEARVEEVQRFLANAFGGFSAVKVEGGFESSDKGLIQEDAVRVVAFASKENENGVPFEQSFESLMNQVKNWCYKWSQQSIGVEFENDLFYVDTETKFADGGYMAKGGEVDLSPYKDIHKLNMLYKSGSKWYAWGKKYNVETKGEGYTKKEALQDLDNHLSYVSKDDKFADGGEVENEVYNAYVVWIDDNDEAFFDGGWWSIEDAEDRVSDIEWEEDNKPKYKVFAVEYDEDYFENKNWDITRMKSYKRYPIGYKRGGKTDDVKLNDIVWYRQPEDNFFFPKNTIYGWLYDDPKASEKLESGEYDFVLFPASGGMGLMWQKGFVPPLLRVWTKKYQNKTKGSDRLIGIVQGWYDEDNKKLYIDMMTTRKDMRRKGVNSHIIRELRKELGLEKGQVEFVKTTKDGEKFASSSNYADGGMMAHGGKITIEGDIDAGEDVFVYVNGKEVASWSADEIAEDDFAEETVREVIELSKKDPKELLRRIHNMNRGMYSNGGDIAEGNLQMLRSNAKAIKHHAEELEGELNDDTQVEAWVVAKGERAATDLSDITHYLDGKKFSLGGMTAGRWYRDKSGEEFKFIGKIDSGENKGRFLFSDGKQSVYKDLEDFEGGRPKETKLFGFFEDGGDLEEGVDLFEDYENMPAKVLMILNKYEDAFIDGDYKGLAKAHEELGKIGYEFEFYLDGQAYDLRKIGQKGKIGDSYAKGGSIKSLEKRVAEVNELIKRGNELGIEVVDESTTWQAPMKYNPLKYTNGVLYVSYEQLDLYKYNREYVQDWEKKSYKIGKYESGYGYRGEAGAAQREALTEIARMYRKPLKSYDTYGYFEDGGEVNKVNPEEIKVKIEQILDKVVPSFYKGVSIHKNIFDTGNNIRIFIAASDYKINGVSGQLPQVVSLSLDLSDMDLHPQVYGGNGGQRVERKPNMNDPKEKYLAMKGVKVPFRTPQPNEKAVLDAIRRFAENYKKTLANNREVLLYQDVVDYDKLLAGSQYADGGMMAKGGEIMKHKHNEHITIELIEPTNKGWKVKQIETHSVGGRKLSTPKEKVAYFSKEELSDLFEPTMAKGGMFEHGLRTNDKIIGGKTIGTTILVENANDDERARIDLNTGKRTVLTYNKKLRKWEDAKGKMAEGGSVGFNQSINEFVKKLNSEYSDSYLYTVDFGKKYAKISSQPKLKGDVLSGKSTWGFIALQDDNAKGFVSGDLLKAAGFNTPAKGSRGNILNGTARYDKYSPQYGKGWRSEGGIAKGGEVIDKLWQGYAEAILFTEIDLDTDEPLDSNYSISDFDSKTVKDSKEMLRKFYNDNKDAIIKSGLDLSIVGNDVWYTRSGQGAGFFDHSLEDDIEKKLIAGAKALGEYPSVETYDGKISVRGGRVFKKGGTFAEGVKAIEKRLVGTKVNPKYQKDYGKTYDKAEAHEAASKIKGKMRALELAKKYKKKK